MKLCLVLQRRFAYISHAMAIAFQKHYPGTAFCGYVTSRESYDFLQSQKDINYTGLLFSEDVYKRYKTEPLDQQYLDWLKNEYGIPNLWPYIEIDRITRLNQFLREYPYDTPKYTHEELMRLLQAKAKATLEFIEKEKPSAIITSVVGDTITLLLYHIAKKKKIRFFFIQEGRVGEEYTITEDYKGLNFVEETFQKLQRGEMNLPAERQKAIEAIHIFRENPAPYAPSESPSAKPINRRKQFSFLLPSKILNSVHWALKLTWDYIKNPYKSDFEIITPWNHFLDHIKRKLRVLRGFEDLYDQANPNEDYAFFPLHQEPEMSLMLLSPFYKDQLWVIKQAAQSLPIHYKLYVKEHPAMFGYRTRSFYKELKKIPSVKIIDPATSSFPLVAGAKIIITISSTVGWEAIFFKKPVITFGDVFYNALSMVKRCRAVENLPDLIEGQLTKFHHDENELINMVTAIFKESANLPLIEMWEIKGGSEMEKKKQQVVPLVKLIAQKLNLQ